MRYADKHGTVQWLNKFDRWGFYLIKKDGTKKLRVRLDPEDIKIAKGFQWLLTDHGYASNSKRVYLHRMILGIKGNKQLADHINHDRLDNRRGNLRVVNSRENCLNNVTNTSGYPGVSYWKNHSGKKWTAQIHKGYPNTKRIFIKCCSTPSEAAYHLWLKGKELFGDKSPYKLPEELVLS